MLQRIQSIYLALVAICIMSLFFSSIALIETIGYPSFIYSIFSLTEVGKNTVNIGLYPTFLMGLTITISMLSIYCFLAFKNRISQMMLVRLNTLLILILIILAILGLEKSHETISIIIGESMANISIITHYLFGSIVPFIALILNVLAFRAIKKDEALVRSSDRIR